MVNISCDLVHCEFIVLVDSPLTTSIDPVESRFASFNFRTMGIISSRDSAMFASSSVLRKKMRGSALPLMDSGLFGYRIELVDLELQSSPALVQRRLAGLFGASRFGILSIQPANIHRLRHPPAWLELKFKPCHNYKVWHQTPSWYEIMNDTAITYGFLAD